MARPAIRSDMEVRSFVSSKAKVGKSVIHGLGLFAIKPIQRGEIVAIKGGHIMDYKTLRKVERKIDESYIQVEDNFYIGALEKSEIKGNKLFINHSCDPNLGIRGQITFVALRNIKSGEELTYDWAMEENRAEKIKCDCRTKYCRKILTGRDWRHHKLQNKYRGFFSSYLQQKINE